MPLSMYRAAVPVFIHGLGTVAALLDKATAHAKAKGYDPDILTGARLAPDMMSLTGQIQRASDTSKLSAERLSGVPSPKLEDNETTIADLQTRIAKTVAYLESIDATTFDGSEAKAINLNFGAFQPSFTGESYLLTFALPNFFFHVTTAYDILRHNGVPVGKRDFLRIES
jgi:hypothetical protein